MEAFWQTWAARIASEQWYVYGDRRASERPEVVSVEIDKAHGTFVVTFENGDVVTVEPNGIARLRYV